MAILKIGSKGEAVEKLQEQLILAGFYVGKGGADGIFGRDTDTAVRAFQKSVNILIDGEVGNDALAMLNRAPGGSQQVFVPGSSFLLSLALRMAQSQVGVVENPRNSNRGKEVEGYLASIGLGGGYAWCMAFVYWCVQQPAGERDMQNPLYKTGGVLMQWNKRPFLRVVRPQCGDIFIMDYGKGAGHCGFVEKVEGQYIYTIEGNTNRNGSREGDGVYRRVRKTTSCKGFLRLDK